ncbi:MAG: hypothetical protein LBM65_02300 [Oscillospiraceae bacterium]|nr:hypothetical protein [Oscillospiraceae bacterium]
MACFVVPAAEAVVVAIVKKRADKAAKLQAEALACGGANAQTNTEQKARTKTHSGEKISISKKLGWLNAMLWGGTALLFLEHVWHGEVVFWPPFLTAAANPADTAAMLYEIATSGVAMAVLVTLVWAGMAIAADNISWVKAALCKQKEGANQ